MKIKFIKEYKAFGDLVLPRKCVRTDYSPNEEVDTIDEAAQWLIDNGFAEEVKEREFPQYGDAYYFPIASFLSERFEPTPDEYCDTVYDRIHRQIGLCYKTKEACQRFIDFLTAVEVVSHDEGFMKPSRKINYSPCGYGVYRGFGKSIIAEVSDTTVSAGEFYFDTHEHAKASVEAHQPEWQTILNYDWSKE